MYKFSIILGIIFLFSPYILAVDYLPDTTMNELTKYECTVQKVEFSPDESGDNWVTAAEGSQITNPTMDIASASFSSKVATFCQDLTLPTGTYRRCRMTFSSAFVIIGKVSYGDNTYRTAAGTDQPSPSDGADAEESTVNNRDDEGNPQSYVQTVSGNLTITEGQTATMRVVMSTDNCLGLTVYDPTIPNYEVAPREPSWTFTQE